ncbi:MAG: type II toxin-antitoxin system VapC family toxin [Shinella sp.]|jgi:ribonuclease VapC|nr:type II toxin-antitoxin system VapC family toxin [Shinella sp.]
MFIDASVIIAILTEEANAKVYTQAMDRGRAQGPLVTSVLATWEATAGLFRKKKMQMEDAEAWVQAFIDAAEIEVLPVSEQDKHVALQAFDRYGRHRYPDAERNRALNLADCFHYAVAKSRRVPILTSDAGFSLTDVSMIGLGR